MKQNPFIISGYLSPEYFCDRKAESARIINAISNRRHMTIFSPRRMGKSGLIRHVFHSLAKRRDISAVYIDIMATSSIEEFVEAFGKAVFTSISRKETALKKILKRLSSLRLKFSIDPLSGEPSVSLDVSGRREAEQTLDAIFRFIAEQKSYYVIAIDEFQQITSYPGEMVEEILRTHIQTINNLSMIFSGSSRHILTEIFSLPNRPFYNITEIMELEKIDTDTYLKFISGHFRRESKSISGHALGRISDITGMHTFYVQYLCNRLFSNYDSVDDITVNRMLLEVITENEPVYGNYLKLLTPMQYRVLKAVALNGGIENPTSKEFISDYNLGAASSVSQAVKSLSDKDFIFHSGGRYHLNDMFFSQWIKYKAE